jgi:FMN reductase
MPDVLILSGSPSRTSRLIGIIHYARKILQDKGLKIEWINVSDLPAEDLISAKFDSPAIQNANRLVENADAILIASPVYKASYTGVLKTYLDLLPQKGLSEKIILPLFIGGSIAHLLSIDYALKPVLSVLAARHILAGVYVVDSQVKWNGQGQLEFEEVVKQRLDDALQEFFEEILWHSSKRRKGTLFPKKA